MDKTLREKYIELVEEQAELEKNSSDQIASLRRTLIRVSLIGDGVDAELDEALDALRDELKAEKKTSLFHELNAAENAVLAFDDRKNKRQTQLITLMEGLSGQLLQVTSSASVKKKIKIFAKKLNANLQKQYGFLSVLNDFLELQKLALSQSEVKSPSLLQKFLGTSSSDSSNLSSASQDDVENINSEPKNTFSLDEDEENFKEEKYLATKIENKNKAAALTVKNNNSREDSISKTDLPIDFQKIANRATEILQSLLDEMSPVDCIEEKIINARERIVNGLSWNDFVPTLEDIRDLIMQSTAESNKNFSTYLNQVNEELKILSQLAKSATFSAQQQDAWQEHVESEVGSQLQSLSKEVNKINDIDELKNSVKDRIKDIRGAIAKPASQEKAKDSLTSKVQVLLSQVKKLEKEAEKTKENLAKEHEKARKDALTELPNREYYNEKSHEEYNRWRRYKNPLSLAVIDIDYFKKINDEYGHQVGDKILKLLAREILKHIRDVDFVARYGGEEFVVLLPETSKENALIAVEKVRVGLASIPFHFNNKPVQITVSIGISQFKDGDTVDSVFARADKALYRAKDKGRNQCVVDIDADEKG